MFPRRLNVIINIEIGSSPRANADAEIDKYRTSTPWWAERMESDSAVHDDESIRIGAQDVLSFINVSQLDLCLLLIADSSTSECHFRTPFDRASWFHNGLDWQYHVPS